VPVVNITNNTQRINFKTTIQTLYWRETWEVRSETRFFRVFMFNVFCVSCPMSKGGWLWKIKGFFT
jgi:hypothetical protein